MGWLYRGGTVWTSGEGLGSGAWRLALGAWRARGLARLHSKRQFMPLFIQSLTQNRTGQAHEDQLAL